METSLAENAAPMVTQAVSAVEFATASRIHISLNVQSLDVSLPFYTALFGAPPTKVKPAYAQFALAEPPLNFTLNERAFERPQREGPVNHFGVQVKDSEAVLAAKGRCVAAGLHVAEETQTACCYAVQTKIWVGDPDGNRWEVFVTTAAESEAFCPDDCLCYAQMTPTAITPRAQ